MFVDSDDDDLADPDEPQAVSDETGAYALTGLTPGPQRVRLVPQDRWTITTPAPALSFTLGPGEAKTGIAVGAHTSVLNWTARMNGNPLDTSPDVAFNTPTQFEAMQPAIAANAQGKSVTVWRQRDVTDGYYIAGAFAARSAFRVSPTGTTFWGLWEPAVAMAASGDFVVAWASEFEDLDSYGVFARRFDAAGNPKGNQFQVNVKTQGSQRHPSVAMDAAGNFTIAWDEGHTSGNQGRAVFRRYDAGGQPLTGEVRLGASPVDVQARPVVAMEPDGDFVAAWSSTELSTQGAIFAQRFDAAGAPRSDPFLVAPMPGRTQQIPAVGVNASGEFVVAWEDATQFPGNGGDVLARRFNALGVPQGEPFRVHSAVNGIQHYTSVVVESDGDFTVSWQDGGGVAIRRYNAAGVPQGNNFFLSTTSLDKGDPRIALGANNQIIVVYSARGSESRTVTDIFSRNFTALGAFVGGATAPVTTTIDAPNSGIALDPLFNHPWVPDGNPSYNVVGSTNPSLFTSVTISSPGLVADFSPSGVGTSEVTVSATAFTGETAYATFQFTVQPTLRGTSASNVYSLRRSSDKLQLFVDHSVLSAPTSSFNFGDLVPAFTLDPAAGNDTIVLDQAGGSVLPAGGIIIPTGAGAKTLTIKGGALAIDRPPAAGAATGSKLYVNDADLALRVVSGATVDLVAPTIFRSVEVAADSRLKLLSGPARVLRANALSLNGTLDLADSGLLLYDAAAGHAGALAALAAVTAFIRSARAGGDWSGAGLTSSAAASDPRRITGVGAILNDRGDGQPLYTVFADSPAAVDAVLVKRAYYGDTNLDGVVDGDDYARVDQVFFGLLPATGWFSGDFDGNGMTNIDDFFLMDKAYANQGGALVSGRPSPLAQIPDVRVENAAPVEMDGLPSSSAAPTSPFSPSPLPASPVSGLFDPLLGGSSPESSTLFNFDAAPEDVLAGA